MITILNRKELLSTFDLAQQAEARSLLTQHQIDHRVRVINRKSPSPMAAGSRARSGTLGENLAAEYEYTIFVEKRQWPQAKQILDAANLR